MASAPPKRSIFSGLGESFLAVLLGNIIYFAASPLLPPTFQHQLFQPDLGLLLDFLVCGAVFGLIHTVRARLISHNK